MRATYECLIPNLFNPFILAFLKWTLLYLTWTYSLLQVVVLIIIIIIIIINKIAKCRRLVTMIKYVSSTNKISVKVPVVARELDITQQAHDVYTTAAQRRCNVMTLHRRWGDVALTSCACRVWTCSQIEKYLNLLLTFTAIKMLYSHSVGHMLMRHEYGIYSTTFA